MEEKEEEEETKAAPFPGKGQSHGSLCSRSLISPPQKEGSVQQMANSIALGHRSSGCAVLGLAFPQPDAQGENKAAGKGAI